MLSRHKPGILGCRTRKEVALISLTVFVIVLLPYVSSQWDPYDVLGVKRDASLDQIKRNYRDLARKLHPDKSNLNEEESGKRFIEVNRAFNILKDPERRRRYDEHGDIQDGRNRDRSYHQNSRRARESFTRHGRRTFTFQFTNEGHLRRQSISNSQFYNEYLSASYEKPFFIFFYAEFCPSCNLIESAWTKITDELAKFNIGSFTIDVHQSPRLAQNLGVTSIPHIACLLDGHVKPYYQTELSLNKVVAFTRSLMPNDLLVHLRTAEDQDSFVSKGPTKNRLSAIILHNSDKPRLRFLILAFGLRKYYRFGHISTKISHYSDFVLKFNLTTDHLTDETASLLVFNEDFMSPSLREEIKPGSQDFTQIRLKLTSWPFLKLPKLFSQDRFDDLCIFSPRNNQEKKSRLCVILFVRGTPSDGPIRNKLIEFVESNGFKQDRRIAFAYMDPYKQSQFIDSLMLETKSKSPVQDGSVDKAILLVERHPQNPRKAHYKWLGALWDPEKPDAIDRAKLELYETISNYTNYGQALVDKVGLDILVDEEGPSLMTRVYLKILSYCLNATNYVISRESFLTIVVIAICALIVSIFFHQAPVPSSERNEFLSSRYSNGERETKRANNVDESNQNLPDRGDLKIMELKAETYFGMVRLLKPGHRSIIVLVDRGTKDELLPEFRKAVWAYRRNKTLMFGYLCLDKNLGWYRSLLQQVLDVDDLKMNKKNCIGTVLSLNGFKKYFRVYHAKHHDIDYFDDETDNDGSFLGFDTEKGNDGNDARGTFQDGNGLLRRLPIWLDKMFDGLTKRYFLEEWPDDMK